MAVEAIATLLRRDGCGVGIELGLGSTESGIGSRMGGGGRNGCEFDSCEGSGDNAGGEGNG